ncbi:MAG: hypothetical protein G01um101424_169 [Parcubacteria group bacterium Gr01-1014_24]|nr:MAG: hypothetical protein G01um101424_169 [Parcubacteria group bacterium Gr01-1014_24]
MEPEKKSNGALVGLIIIIIILVIGGIYIWQSNKMQEIPTEPEAVTTEDSDGLNTLEAEINTTDIDIGASIIDSVE